MPPILAVLLLIVLLILFQVLPGSLHHKNPLTPYMGMELYGKVDSTIVGGKVAYQRGGFTGEMNGQMLLN